MSTTEIIALLAALTQAATRIVARIFETNELLRKMNAEGWTTLTDEELATLKWARDMARQGLIDEIAKAKLPKTVMD